MSGPRHDAMDGRASGPEQGGRANAGAPPPPPIVLDGARTIRASREHAWAILTDPAAVAACLPVAATAETIPPDAFCVVATVTVVLFPIRLVVTGRFVERVAPERAVLAGTAVVPGGGVTVQARLELRADAEDATTLTWQLEATPTGLAATLAGQGVPPAVLEGVERTLSCLVARAEG